jgi:hypothetical protein
LATTDALLAASGQPFIAPDEEPLSSNSVASLFFVGLAGLTLSGLFLQQSCDLLASPDEQACPDATTV